MICHVLDQSCAVLELVCTQFCYYMSKNSFWVDLYCLSLTENDSKVTLRRNNQKMTSNNIIDKNKTSPFVYNINNSNHIIGILVREMFFTQSQDFHWDEQLILTSQVQDLVVSNNGKTIEEITNKQDRWKITKCLEPIKIKKERFWFFAMNVDRCDTQISYVGFGVSLRLIPENKYASGAYPDKVGTPWIWHAQDDKTRFKKGDLIGCIGGQFNGKYYCNFFQNYKLLCCRNGILDVHNFFSYNYSQDVNNSHYIHFAVVTGEKFTIQQLNRDQQIKLIGQFMEKHELNGSIDSRRIVKARRKK